MTEKKAKLSEDTGQEFGISILVGEEFRQR